MNVEMEERAERLRERFPPPTYRVELRANETQIWVVNESNHAIAEIGEWDFAMDPEGPDEMSYIREALA